MKIEFGEKYLKKVILCLGMFDAIHIGHRALILKAKELAGETDSIPAFFVFDERYNTLFKSSKPLYSLEERIKIIESLCENALIVKVEFDEAFINTEAIDFLKKLDELFIIDKIVVGKDYTFGYKGCGNVDILKKYFEQRNVEVFIEEIVCYGGEKVSSTKIRSCIEDGDAELASKLLGDPYYIKGRVLHGRKAGSKIGIPTANIDLDEKYVWIKDGVYVTSTKVDGKCYPSVTNVGAHPTYGDFKKNAETHIIDSDIELYGKDMTVCFIKRIRDIFKFDTVEDLRDQIENDKAFALKTLSEIDK